MSVAHARIYLDHNATSPVRPESRRAMHEATEAAIGNPASLHTEGRAARAVVEAAREHVAALAAVPASEVVFTSGGSEAIAAAIRGVADRAPEDRRRVVVSTIEHSAVLEAVAGLERGGFEIVRVGCDRQGRVELDAFIAAIRGGAALAALQWANNETGVLQPVEDVGRVCREAGVAFFVDAVQAVGKVVIDPRRACVDLLAISGHKLGAPAGTGALVIRHGIALAPLIAGGSQERKRRGGTQSAAALAGFGAAARAALARLEPEAERLLRLRARLETRLRRLFADVRIHGESAARLPNTVNFALPGLSGETLVIALDLAGVAASTGSACSSGAVEPSHVIRAMGQSEHVARGAVRLSLGWSTTPDDVDRFLDLMPAVVEQARLGDSAARC